MQSKNERKVYFIKNLSNKIQAKCKAPCAWYFYTSKLRREDTFQITRLQLEHICNRQWENYAINSNWIAKHYEDEIRMNPTWGLDAFHNRVVNDLNMGSLKKSSLQTKMKALQAINGKHEEQYKLL